MTRYLSLTLLAVGTLSCSSDAGCSNAEAAAGGEAVEGGEAVADTLIDVGDYRLHVVVARGTAPMTVVFEAGGGADLTSWGSVPEQLAAATSASVVTYDRAGLGTSELGPLDLTQAEEVQALRRALDTMELPPSTVVAHSYGALMAMVHAQQFPDLVEALVLVDPMNPRFMDEVGDWLKTTVPTITDPTTNREYVTQRMSRTFDALAAELLRVRSHERPRPTRVLD
jgi:pimeloyl-ACP methyl ester carboxylesterase